MKRSILCGIVGGIILSLPFSLTFFLFASTTGTKILKDMFILIVLSSIITGFVLLYKNWSFKHALLREIVMFACCIITFRFFAIVGIFKSISNIMHINISQYDSPGEGLPGEILLITVFIESIAIKSIILIRAWIKRRLDSDNPVDGSI